MKKLIFISLILLFAASAEADLVQCPKGAFTTGVTKGEVILKCGIPQSQERRTVHKGEEGFDDDFTVIDEFVYDIVGCHAVLTFVKGKLIKIQKF